MAVHRRVSVKNFLITPLDGSFLRAARFQTIIHRGAGWRELAIISKGQDIIPLKRSYHCDRFFPARIRPHVREREIDSKRRKRIVSLLTVSFFYDDSHAETLRDWTSGSRFFVTRTARMHIRDTRIIPCVLLERTTVMFIAVAWNDFCIRRTMYLLLSTFEPLKFATGTFYHINRNDFQTFTFYLILEPIIILWLG